MDYQYSDGADLNTWDLPPPPPITFTVDELKEFPPIPPPFALPPPIITTMDENKAASIIQRQWRGYHARIVKAKWIKAILMVQKLCRGRIARKEYKKLLEESRWQRDIPPPNTPKLNIITRTKGMQGRKRPTRGVKVASKEVIDVLPDVGDQDNNNNGEEGTENGESTQSSPPQPKLVNMGNNMMVPKFDPSMVALKPRGLLAMKDRPVSVSNPEILKVQLKKSTPSVEDNSSSSTATEQSNSFSPVNLRRTVMPGSIPPVNAGTHLPQLTVANLKKTNHLSSSTGDIPPPIIDSFGLPPPPPISSFSNISFPPPPLPAGIPPPPSSFGNDLPPPPPLNFNNNNSMNNSMNSFPPPPIPTGIPPKSETIPQSKPTISPNRPNIPTFKSAIPAGVVNSFSMDPPDSPIFGAPPPIPPAYKTPSNIPAPPPSNVAPPTNLPPPPLNSGNNNLPPPITGNLPPPPMIPNNLPPPPPLNSGNLPPPPLELGGAPKPGVSKLPQVNIPLPALKTSGSLPNFNNIPNIPPPIQQQQIPNNLPPPPVLNNLPPPPMAVPSNLPPPPALNNLPPSLSNSTGKIPPPLSNSFGNIPPPLSSSINNLPPPQLPKAQPNISNPPMLPPFGTQQSTPNLSNMARPPPNLSIPPLMTPASMAPPTNNTFIPPVTLPPPTFTRQLKPGWAEYSTQEGKKYYHNKAENRTVWDPSEAFMNVQTPTIPTGAAPQQPQSLTPTPVSTSTDYWIEYTTADGKKYYHNKTNNHTVWSKPSGVEIHLPNSNNNTQSNNNNNNNNNSNSNNNTSVPTTSTSNDNNIVTMNKDEKKRVGGILNLFLRKRPTKQDLESKHILDGPQQDQPPQQSKSNSKKKK